MPHKPDNFQCLGLANQVALIGRYIIVLLYMAYNFYWITIDIRRTGKSFEVIR